MFKKAILTLGLLCSLVAGAFAVNNNFKFHNHASYPIVGLWASPHASSNWGPNLINGEVDGNEYLPVEIDFEGRTDWDFKIEYGNGIVNENRDGHDLAGIDDVTVLQVSRTVTRWIFE
jgi:hypothetical protein